MSKEHLIGAEELSKKLLNLEKKVSRKAVMKGLRAAAKIVQAESIRNAPVGATGALARGIKVRSYRGKGKNKNQQGLKVQLSAKTQKGDSFYAPFLEYGVKSGTKVGGKTSLAKRDGSWRIPPMGFLRRALDTKGREAIEESLRITNDEIIKLATK